MPQKIKELAIFSPDIYRDVVFTLQYRSERIFPAIRNHSTPGEIFLWKKLRAGGMMNYSFNRQKPLNRYIVDFYCKPLSLVIEIDGTYHNEEAQIIKDKERQQILESMGLNFRRFSEQQVRKDMEIVLKTIENYILDYEEKHPEVKTAIKRYR